MYRVLTDVEALQSFALMPRFDVASCKKLRNDVLLSNSSSLIPYCDVETTIYLIAVGLRQLFETRIL